jgi:hypothetical protein
MAESARGGVLDSILPALTLAQASVVGIGIPGVEAIINCVFQLATMVSVRQSTFIATCLRSSLDDEGKQGESSKDGKDFD